MLDYDKKNMHIGIEICHVIVNSVRKLEKQDSDSYVRCNIDMSAVSKMFLFL